MSVLAALVMIGAVVGLVVTRSLFSWSPAVIAVQVGALALVGWARVTFGLRSFHYAANPTEGGLVTKGPYRYLRHPIYTAVCLFAGAGVVAHWSPSAALLGGAVLVTALVRMYCEERLLVERYPEYREYARHTKRMVPFIF